MTSPRLITHDPADSTALSGATQRKSQIRGQQLRLPLVREVGKGIL